MKNMRNLYLILVLFSGLMLTVNAGYCAKSAGSSAFSVQKQVNVCEPIKATVFEYDTYYTKTGYYVNDSFGRTILCDVKNNVVYKYEGNTKGKTYLYDKYNKPNGYFDQVATNKTMIYDRYDNPVGYFSIGTDGLLKKYDLEGVHLNTYKNR